MHDTRARGGVQARTARVAATYLTSASIAAVAVGSIIVAQVAPAANGNPGRDAYFRFCASCHGETGQGNGELAGSLRPKPADLTRLAQKNGGAFPYAAVKEIIDGRKRVVAHGTAAMPVWGKIFAEEESYEQPDAHARSQIGLITDYLASIQAK